MDSCRTDGYDDLAHSMICDSLPQELSLLKDILGRSMDLNVAEIRINGVDCAVISIEAMVSTLAMSELIFQPLMSLEGGDKRTAAEIMRFCTEESLMSGNKVICYTNDSAVKLLFSGFALILADGVPFAAAFGIQGYAARSVSSPLTENELYSSQEAFAEVIRTNISLIRRRIKHPALTFEMQQCGRQSNTDVCIVYIRGKADARTVAGIRERLSRIKLDGVLNCGFVKPFLEQSPERLIFSEIGTTERPDLLCANLLQGRIGILTDGSPFALICPYLFTQNFETVDDYSVKTYYASFVKMMRMFAFILAVAFPGIYLAAVDHDPEMLNLKLLLNLATGEKTTLLPLFTELVIIMLLLEILREASVRLPHAIGTAMSIAGGLIIGDTAVKSGLISSPLLIIVGLTATASFVLPAFGQQITVLRLVFIFAGGFAGFFGISLCAVMLTANVCAQSFGGVPFTSPLAPLRKSQLAGVIGRKNYTRLENERTTTKELK